MLRVTDLTAGYGDTVVLRDVSLEVRSGQVVALLGPNGAGKTTLLRAIAGELPALSGSVHLMDSDVTAEPTYRRARHGLCHIPEGRAIFPNLNVRDNLIMQSPKGKEKESIARAVEVFPFLKDRMRQVAGSLSGGQQQMLAMSRAYLAAPRLVLVDEASMGLAPVIVDQVFDFLHKIVEEGASLLLVEQYVTRALDMADYAYLLSHGGIVTHGDAAALKDEDLFSKYLGMEAAH
ncbi:ABC transporter ATP-binding protein [Jatrophihabitans sp. DSM 45814]